jgi:hypothetical protein
MNLQTGEVSKAQPYISRLTKLGVAAAERGKGLELLKEVSAIIFGGARLAYRRSSGSGSRTSRSRS